MNPYYTDYAEYLGRLFPGGKVQKLSIDGGMTCPNRDGTLGTGGCIYCDNRTFSPEYTRRSLSVTRQVQEGMRFFSRKYPSMRYLAYFQNFTSTYAGARTLEKLYLEALQVPGVVGLVIGTRPDMLPLEVLDLLENIARETTVMVELGAETSRDDTLYRINRHHTWRQVCEAAETLHTRRIETGLHLIAGLPGENADDLYTTVERCAALPISSLKLHQMQVIAGTELHRQYMAGDADLMPLTLDDYLHICAEVVRRVPRRIAIERFVSQAPPGMLVHPRWGVKNHEFTHKLHTLLKNIALQQ